MNLTRVTTEEEALLSSKLSLLFTYPADTNQTTSIPKYHTIVNPNAIWDILSLIEQSSTDKQLYLLNELLSYFQEFPLNSLIIVDKTRHQLPNKTSLSIIDCFIKLSLTLLATKPEISYKLLNVLQALYHMNVLQRNHLSIVYSFLSTQFYENQLTSASISFAIKFLQQALSQQIEKSEEPSSFFYFTGLESGIVINPTQSTPLTFNNGFALSTWFYLDYQNENDSEAAIMNKKLYPKLFTIHSNGNGGIEAYFSGKNLYYRTIGEEYVEPRAPSQDLFLATFEFKKWYYLGVELEKGKGTTKSCLKVVANDEYREHHDVKFPFKEEAAPVTNASFGVNLSGRISSLILYKSPIGHFKLMETNSILPLGIHSEAVMKGVNALTEKLLDKIQLIYTPLRSAGNVCYDAVNNLHGTVLKTAGICQKDSSKVRLGAFGGVASLLPFFYFLRFISDEKNPEIVDDLWRTLVILFKNFPEAQFEASKLGLFRILGQLLAENNKNKFSSSTIELLAELRSCLTQPKISEEMFLNIFWNVDIFINADAQIQNQVWAYLKTIYLQNPAYYVSLYDVRDILDLLVDKFDSPFQVKDSKHGKIDWNCANTEDIKQAEKVFGPFLNIIETILFAGGETVSESILSIVNLLGFNCSSHLHLLLLKMLKNILVDRRDDSMFTSKVFVKTLMDCKAPQFILYLMTYTHCFDLKAMCLKVLNVLLTHPLNNCNKVEVSQYISNIIVNPSSEQKDQEMDFDKLFAKDESPLKEHIERIEPAPPILKGPKGFTKSSKLTLPDIDEEQALPRNPPSTSSFQSTLQSDLMSSSTDKKLAEMSLNLRSSIPKGRIGETDSFRKNKTFDFTKGGLLSNDLGGGGGPKGFEFGSTLGPIGSQLPSSSSQSEELVLDVPAFGLKKKGQPSSSTSKHGTKIEFKLPAELNLEDQNKVSEPKANEVKLDPEPVKPEVKEENPEKEEEKGGTNDFVLPKSFPKAGDLKRKKKNLAIVSELDNEDQQPNVEPPKNIEVPPVEVKNEPEEVKQPEVEKIPEKPQEPVEEEFQLKKPPGKLKKGFNLPAPLDEPSEPQVEPKIEPKPKPKGKGLGMGKKKFVPGGLGLDIDAINDEFTFGGEKGQKMMDEGDIEKIMKGVFIEVEKLAHECADYMRLKEKEAEKPVEQPKVQEEVLFREPKNMPPSVRGSKKIEFGSRAFKPQIEIEEEPTLQPVTSTKKDFLKTNYLKPSLDVVKETNNLNLTERSEEFSISSSLDQASPEQNQPIIFRTTPKGQVKPSLQAVQSKNQTEASPSEIGYESIYNSLIEWLLHKQPTSVPGNVVIDDTDKISSVEVLPVMIRFFKSADERLRQKMMQDIYILVKWNPTNCSAVLQVPEFHSFLLDVLYDYQILLYTSELREVPMMIWELGTKAHTVLLKHALIQDPEGYKQLQGLFVWLYTKRAIAANKPNPLKYEKGAQYLLRHLWLNLLEGLLEVTSTTKPSIDSTFWKNLQQVAFATQEIVASPFKSEDSNSSTANPISNLSASLTKLSPGEDFPYNFKAIFAKSYWVDWKICETFFKVIESIWTGSGKFAREECSKVLDLLLGEALDNNVQGRGSLLKITLELLASYLEDNIENGTIKGVEATCGHIERVLKSLLVVLENSNNESLISSNKELLISSVLYALALVMKGIAKSSDGQHKNVSKPLNDCILSILKLIKENEIPRLAFKGFSSTGRGVGNVSANKEVASAVISALDLENELDNLEESSSVLENLREKLENEGPTQQLVEQYYTKTWKTLNSEIGRNMEEKALAQGKAVSEQDRISQEGRENSRKDIVDMIKEVCETERQRRKDIIVGNETYKRSGRSSWKKVWKRLRVYAGQWKHPDFYDQDDKKDKRTLDNAQEGKQSDKVNKNDSLFIHKISKYEIKSRARPFLKVSLIEPKHAEDDEKNVDKLREKERNEALRVNDQVCITKSDVLEELRGERSPQAERSSGRGKLTVPSLWSTLRGGFSLPNNNMNYSQIHHGSPTKHDNQILNKTNSFSPSTRLENMQREEVFLNKKCQWIQPLTLKNGWLQITSHRLIFSLDNTSPHPEPKFSLVNPKNSGQDEKVMKEWALDFIKEIQKKRFLKKKTALEVHMVDGSTLLFNFPEGELEEVSQKLVRMRKTRCPNLIYYGSLDPKKIIDKANITKKWLNFEITNFEYLMWLNAFSGRSYNDLTQYPVFPWLLSDYWSSNLNLSDANVYRDLAKPKTSGAQTNTAITVFEFLHRLQPYLNYIIKTAERKNEKSMSFTSIEETYKKTSEELIPEFFFLPDLFNQSEASLSLESVDLPNWCGISPYQFVATLRRVLESDAVSKTLHNWIDLTFGYKQLSKETEPNPDEAEESNHVWTFGQAPSQLFSKPHPQRTIREGPSYKLIVDPGADVRVYRPPTKNKSKEPELNKNNRGTLKELQNLGDSALIKMKVINDTRLIGLRKDGRLTYFKWWNTPINQEGATVTPFKCGIEKEKMAKLNKGKHDWCDNIDYSVQYVSYPAVFLNMGKIIVAGGYWDGRLSLFSTDNDSLIEAYFYHNDTITAVANDHKENFLITGSKSGECIVWKISAEMTKLSAKFHFYDHNDMITNIYISNDMRLFATASLDGKINIYHFIVGRLLRTIHHPQNLPIQTVVLSSCPLPCVIFSSEKDQSLYSYSINGKLLEQVSLSSAQCASPLLIKDSNSMESLAYGTEKGELYLRKLPFLEQIRKWDVSVNCPVLNVLVSKDKRYLFCGCSDGEFSVLTDPSFSVQSQAAPPSQQNDTKVV